MSKHISVSSEARSAVIAGNLEQANAKGVELRKLTADELPEEWRQRLADLQLAARSLEGAPNIRMAADAVGEIGQTCASCHRAMNGGPKFDGSDIPSQTWSEKSHMPRHKWASEWMWLGMLANNDEAFLRGAKSLADDPLKYSSPTRPEWFAEAEAEVHRIAKEMVASEAASRHELYGPLLAQCGTCHLRLETEGATPR